MVNLSKFTSNKKYIEWNCSLRLQPNLLSNLESNGLIFQIKSEVSNWHSCQNIRFILDVVQNKLISFSYNSLL